MPIPVEQTSMPRSLPLAPHRGHRLGKIRIVARLQAVRAEIDYFVAFARESPAQLLLERNPAWSAPIEIFIRR